MEEGTLPEHGGTSPSCSLVVSPHGDNREFGQGDVPMESNGYLLEAPNSQTILTIVVSHGVRCLKPGPLASTDLFLHGHDLQSLILEADPQKNVSDVRLLDGQEERDLLQGFYLHVLDQVAQLSLASSSARIQAGPPLSPTPGPQEHLHTSAIWCILRKEVPFILIRTNYISFSCTI